MAFDRTMARRVVQQALEEDGYRQDVTTQGLVPVGKQASAAFVARTPLVVSGVEVPQLTFDLLEGAVQVRTLVEDGAQAQAGEPLVQVEGDAAAILTGERTALNLMQRMSAVASVTRQFVDAVVGTGATILDTRKTMPGLRVLDKYAVACGGGQNHRMGLHDMMLIKDNHIALCGGVGAAIAQVGQHNADKLPVVVECDTLAQLAEVLEVGADRALLDNMSRDALCEAVAMVKGTLPLEASGNVTLETVRIIAETGVDYISIGALTHSAPAVDIGLDITIS